MKIKNSWIFAVLFLLCVAAGCTSAKAESMDASDGREEIAAASENTAAIVEKAEQESAGGSGESLTGELSGEMSHVPRKLTEAELRDFSQWINAEENYAFLLSEYEEASQIEEALSESGEKKDAVLFVCVGGREMEEGKYELDCVPEGVSPGSSVHSCQLVLEKDGGDFHILSNVYTDSFKHSKENWRIVNQSFQVDFEGSWGEVTFNSYAPEKHLDTLQDVSFTLSRDEAELFAFPDVIVGNYRSEEHFDEVLAVSFRDYDGDEQRDVTIICRYVYGSGDKAGDTFNEVRLYQNQGDTFVLDRERMDWLNENGLNRNIDEVLKHADDAFLHEK